MLIGADPGSGGGLALYDWRTGAVDTHRLPTCFEVMADGREVKRIDAPALWALAQFLAALEPTGCVLEKVHGYGGQDASRAFTFGRSYGELRFALVIALQAIGVRPVHAPPSTWKGVLRVSSDKALACARASELLPQAAHLWPHHTTDDGLAEAALLAYYGAHVLGLDGCEPSAAKRPRQKLNAKVLNALTISHRAVDAS